MSSKSKHRPAQRPHAQPGQKVAPVAPGLEPKEEKGLLSQDVIKVPRGMGRWQFLLLVGLLILLLMTFLVTGPIEKIFRRGNERNPVTMRWNRPGHGPVELRGSDLQWSLAVFRLALDVDPLLGYSLGFGLGSRLESKDCVRLLVLDQLAEDSGLTITDADLVAHLQDSFQFHRPPWTSDDFRSVIQRLGSSQITVEETIRRLLRLSRFLQFAGYAAAIPDPKVIEEQFHEENVEFTFEYAALVPEKLEPEARAQLPDEAQLRQWFESRPEAEKNQLRTPEKRRADFALFRDPEATPAAALVEAFPEKPVEGVEPSTSEQLAQTYYTRVFHRRFMKPAEEPGGDGEDPGGGDERKPRSFEEVKDQCLAEAPVYFALQRWLDDLKTRKTAGEAIDLAAEAAKYGLEHRALEGPLSRDELAQLEGLGDRELADAVFQAAPDGSFYYALVPYPGGLAVARALERIEPVLPPFEEIRARVEEQWIKPKAEELALEKLKTLWQGLEQFTPEKPAPEAGQAPFEEPADTRVHRRAASEAFRAAAQGAEVEVATRDWLNRGGPPDADPQRDSPAHRFLATQYELYELAPDEVAEPQLARDKHAAYLVRLAGKREVPLERMTPAQYERYKQGARARAIAELGSTLDLAFLEKHYGLWLRSEEQEPSTERPVGAPAPDSGGDTGY